MTVKGCWFPKFLKPKYLAAIVWLHILLVYRKSAKELKINNVGATESNIAYNKVIPVFLNN